MGRGARRKCRLWWPRNISSPPPSGSGFLFGWLFPPSAASIDVVVAFSCLESEFTSSPDPHVDLQEIIQQTNKNMSTPLQGISRFSLLGYFSADSRGSDRLARYTDVTDKCVNLSNDLLIKYANNHECWGCGCPKYDGMPEGIRFSDQENMWIKLWYDFYENVNGRVLAIPKLDHLHWNSEIISEVDLHVLLYEIPVFGGHHYSLGIHSLSNNVISSRKKPSWLCELQQRPAIVDLDFVIQAMNSAEAAKKLFQHRHSVCSRTSLNADMFCDFMWKLFATSVASFSTSTYIVLQCLHIIFSWLSHSYMGILLSRVFSNSLKNIHFRCCQILYWPIFLQDQTVRDCSCVEFAERTALHRHSIWSNVLIDVLLGNIFGIALWFMVEPACLRVSNFASDFTNNLLRTGCVWLMGDPAGFKLNTELAGILGIISLNAIQIWSTLWIFMGSLFVHFTKMLALCGIIFGLTSAAALVIDIISLATMHVLTLHLFLSFLYSTQIQAVASLWRLFRGKKLNPLRSRLDSYEYTIEQHVVGSLLFTTILLLLPTTSVFYIFFTMLHASVIFLCVVIEATISFIHSTPYAKIFLWLRRRKRFPSGIWFDVVLCKMCNTEAVTGSNGVTGKKACASDNSKSTILVSFLRSINLSLGEVIWPYYNHLFSSFSKSSISSLAYQLLIGRSIPYPRVPSLPLKLQWMTIPWKEYWCICYNSVFGCKENPI